MNTHLNISVYNYIFISIRVDINYPKNEHNFLLIAKSRNSETNRFNLLANLKRVFIKNENKRGGKIKKKFTDSKLQIYGNSLHLSLSLLLAICTNRLLRTNDVEEKCSFFFLFFGNLSYDARKFSPRINNCSTNTPTCIFSAV